MSRDADSLLLELREAAARHGDPDLRTEVADVLYRATISIIEPDEADETTLNGTASIRRVGASRYRIIFWRAFFERIARTSEDRLFVLLHELAHQRHGDLVRYHLAPRPENAWQIVNVAEDMVINAELCQRWFPTGVPMLRRMIAHAAEHGERPTIFNHLLIAPMAIFDFYHVVIVERYPGAQWLAEDDLSYAQLNAWGSERFAELLQACLSPGRTCPTAEQCLAQIAQVYVLGWFQQAPIWNLASWIDACVRRCPRCESSEKHDDA